MRRISARSIARWTVLFLGIGLALVYLNSAAYSWWASWGPPTNIPDAWRHRAFAHFCLAMTAISFAFALFRTLGPSLRADRVVWISLAVGAAFWAGPSAAGFIEVDRCLDAGGCWNRGAFRCEFSSQEACDAR
jgi:hypothetical protein